MLTDEKKELKKYLAGQGEKLSTLTASIQTTLNTLDKTAIAPDWLKTVINKYNFPEKLKAEKNPKTLFQYVEHFIGESSNRKDKGTGLIVTSDTIKQYEIFYKHLRNFAMNERKKDFDFSDINQAFYDRFVLFMQEKSFAQNTVGKTIKILKTILNEATAQGYNTNSCFKGFSVFKEDYRYNLFE